MPGQVVERRQAEMLEEEVGRAPGHGLAGARRRPIGLIQFCSNSRSSVPLLKPTPRTCSISARVTGWWKAMIARVSIAAPRQFARHRPLDLELLGKIRRRAESIAARHLHQVDAAVA
jgi:hypothetical protein